MAVPLVALAVLCMAAPARADDLQILQAARTAFEQQEYAASVRGLERLVGGDEPRVSGSMRLESRQYLAAAYLYVDRPRDARQQFLLLLRENPDYELDPLQFSQDVLRVFRAVRERELRRRAERQERERAAAALLRDAAMIERLRALAAVNEHENSRLVATLPFGVGQFQNGHEGLGWVLAISSGLLAATSITTFLIHQSLANPDPRTVPRVEWERAELGLALANQIATGLLGLVAVAGIVDAHLRFVPVRRMERDLSELSAEEPSVELSLSPTGLGLSVTF